MKVSVVLPTYNEADNIVGLVKMIVANIPDEWQHEIIVVDDNSPDGTLEVVQRAFGEDSKVIPILRVTDRGLAKSIRAGLERAQGDHLVIMDTDFTHDPAEIPKMLHLGRVANIVVGSRFCAGGAMEDVPHYLFSLFYNWFIRVVLRTQIQDNLSGFLLIDRDSLLQLPFDRIFFGYGDYCFRLLHYAQKRNLSLLEIPVKYRTRQKGQSKSVFWKLFFSYTRALIKLKLEVAHEPPPNKKTEGICQPENP